MILTGLQAARYYRMKAKGIATLPTGEIDYALLEQKIVCAPPVVSALSCPASPALSCPGQRCSCVPVFLAPFQHSLNITGPNEPTLFPPFFSFPFSFHL